MIAMVVSVGRAGGVLSVVFTADFFCAGRLDQHGFLYALARGSTSGLEKRVDMRFTICDVVEKSAHGIRRYHGDGGGLTLTRAREIDCRQRRDHATSDPATAMSSIA